MILQELANLQTKKFTTQSTKELHLNILSSLTLEETLFFEVRSTSRIPKTEGSKIDGNRRPVELPAVRAAQLGELNTRAERAIKTARIRRAACSAAGSTGRIAGTTGCERSVKIK